MKQYLKFLNNRFVINYNNLYIDGKKQVFYFFIIKKNYKIIKSFIKNYKKKKLKAHIPCNTSIRATGNYRFHQ